MRQCESNVEEAGLLLFGVVVVVAATLRLVDLVHDHADEVLVAKFRGSLFRDFVAGFARANDKQDAIAEVGEAACVMDGKRWRRVENDPIEGWRDGVEQDLHSVAEQQFAGIRDACATRDEAEIRRFAVLHDAVLVGFAAQIIREPECAWSPERGVQARSAQVGVDQEGAFVGLANDRTYEIGGDESLALTLCAAGDQDAAKTAHARDLIKARTKCSEALSNDTAAFAGK